MNTATIAARRARIARKHEASGRWSGPVAAVAAATAEHYARLPESEWLRRLDSLERLERFGAKRGAGAA
jgi:hypothetical protein